MIAMAFLSERTRTAVVRTLLSAAVLPLTAVYPLTFLFQDDIFLTVAVLSLALMLVNLSWYRWMWGIYVFVGCIPLLNTVNTIFHLPQPGISMNLVMLAALTTSWALHMIWRRPIADRNSRVFLIHTPVDILVATLAATILIALPCGWMRFNNVLCPGFYQELPHQLARIPFFTLLDTYLCFTRAWIFLQLGFAFYLFCSSIRHRTEMRNILWICAASGCLVCISGIVQYRYDLFYVGTSWYFHRISATLNGPHSAGVYFAGLSVLCLALMVATESPLRKVLLFITLLLSLTGLWFTQTRSAAFSLLAVVAMLGSVLWVGGLFRSARVRAASMVVLATALFVGPGSLLLPERGVLSVIARSPQYQAFTAKLDVLRSPDANRQKLNEWLSFRFFHWNAASAVVAMHPIAGAGLGTFDKLYRRVRLENDTYKTAYTHALFLDVYTEMGIVAVAALFGIYCTVIVLTWKLFRAREVSWRWRVMGIGFLTAFCAGYVASFVTSDLYYVLEIQLWFVLLLALVVRNYQMHFTPVPQSLVTYWRLTLHHAATVARSSKPRLAAVSLVLVALAGGCVYTVVSAARDGRDFFASAQPYTINDRILEYGIHHYETDTRSNQFARTDRVLYKPLRVKEHYLRISLRADHPDAEARPVTATIKLDNIVLGTITLSNRMWTVSRFNLGSWKDSRSPTASYAEGIPAVLCITSSRTWNPFRLRRGSYDLDFGVDLGAIQWGYY